MWTHQTAPIGAVCSWSTLFASILNSSVMLGNYLQQTTFSDAFFFLGALRVKVHCICVPGDWLNVFTLENNAGPGEMPHSTL